MNKNTKRIKIFTLWSRGSVEFIRGGYPLNWPFKANTDC